MGGDEMARITALKSIPERDWQRIEAGLESRVARELRTVRRQLQGNRHDRDAARARAEAILLLVEIAQAQAK
jgi:hypothetical protein